MEIKKESIEILDKRLTELVDEEILNKKHDQIIRLRYGVGCQQSDFKSMLKLCKLNPKNMKKELLEAEKRVFNILKKRL